MFDCIKFINDINGLIIYLLFANLNFPTKYYVIGLKKYYIYYLTSLL